MSDVLCSKSFFCWYPAVLLFQEAEKEEKGCEAKGLHPQFSQPLMRHIFLMMPKA